MKKKLSLQKIFNIKLGKHIYINIWFFLVLFHAFQNKYISLFLVAFMVALIHELSHIFCAKILGISVLNIKLYPFGVCAKLSSDYIQSSNKEFLIAFFGPFSNIILFFLSHFMIKIFPSALLSFFADVNLAMCILNILPALPLDGGRMVKSILVQKFGIISSYKFITRLSKIIIILIFIISIIMFMFINHNFSLILVSAFLLQNFCNEQNHLTLISFKEILYNRSKLEKILPGRILCANENQLAKTLIRKLTYDYFYIVHIISSCGKIKKTVTETQVLEKIIKNGIKTKYADI